MEIPRPPSSAKSKPAALILIFAATAFLVWKSQYGVDLTDESFYALPAWKLFQLGDAPFRDEIFNAPRQNDWLNYHTIARIVPFSLIDIRRSAILFYAVCLFAALTLFFRRRISWALALTFSACLLFDINFMPTWSYNWWVRNALLVHHALVAIAFAAGTPDKKSRVLFLAAGIPLGIGWLAYNSIVPFHLLLFVPFVIWLFREKRASALFYLSGVALPLSLFAIDFVLHSRWPDFRASLAAMASLGDYNSSFSLAKLHSLVSFFGSYPLFWLLGGFALTFKRFPRVHAIVCAFFLVYLAKKIFYSHSQYFVLHAFVTVGFWGAYLALSEKTGHERKYLVGLAVITVLVVGLSSVARMWAMAWATPVLWLVFLARMERESLRWYSRAAYVLVLVFIAKDCFLLQKNLFSTFYDVPLAQADTRVEAGPLKGTYTSARRAFLVGEIARLTEGKKFILSLGDFPGAMLFGHSRSAIDTTFTDLEASPAMLETSLTKMMERKRFPELYLVAKQHPWTWGMRYPPTPPFTKTPYPEIIKGNRLVDFVRCSGGNLLLSEPELEIREVVSSQLEPCLRPELRVAERAAPSMD